MKTYLYPILLLIIISRSAMGQNNTQQSMIDTSQAIDEQLASGSDPSYYVNMVGKKFQQAIDLNPKDAEAYYNLGNALDSLARLEKDAEIYKIAIEKYQKAIELDPKYTAAYLNCGNGFQSLAILGRDGNTFEDIELYKKAIEKYQYVIQVAPKCTDAYYNCGNSLSELALMENDSALFKKAIENYQQVIKIDPKSKVTYYAWGASLCNWAAHNDDNAALYQQAIEKYQKVIELDPKFTFAYYTISYIYSWQHKDDEAFVWLKQALECNKTTKELSKKEFVEQFGFRYIKHDKRFIDLMDQYFPSN